MNCFLSSIDVGVGDIGATRVDRDVARPEAERRDAEKVAVDQRPAVGAAVAGVKPGIDVGAQEAAGE